MKLQLWVVNSSLLIALLLLTLFIFLYSIKLPRKQSLIPTGSVSVERVIPYDVNIPDILKNDLFNTYQPPVQRPYSAPSAASIPAAPRIQPASVPALPKRKFIEPLNITLAGVFAFTDDTENKAIIIDNKSKEEKTYRVGDEIDDAQIINILDNRVILVRANGQQETLYIKQEDAEHAEKGLVPKNWNHVVRKMGNFQYNVDVSLFGSEVGSLGRFLDMLDITTVYRDGSSIGTKVGKLEDTSLAQVLGLEPGDLIVSINDIATTSLEDNERIFRTLSALPLNSTVTVKLKRQGMPIQLQYKLMSFGSVIDFDRLDSKKDTKKTTTVEDLESEKIKTLRKTEKFAPTYYDLMQKEKEAVRQQNEDRKRNPWLSKK